MTASELRRLLKNAGATIEDGTRHTLVTLNGRNSAIPRHPSHEIKGHLVRKIMKDLGTALDELRRRE
ncbi:MAG: type II toxin-antitoxin system HicA family toxin [Bryobacteraceae bacterium]